MSQEQTEFVMTHNPEFLEEENFKFVDYLKKVSDSPADCEGEGEDDGDIGEGEGEGGDISRLHVTNVSLERIE